MLGHAQVLPRISVENRAKDEQKVDIGAEEQVFEVVKVEHELDLIGRGEKGEVSAAGGFQVVVGGGQGLVVVGVDVGKGIIADEGALKGALAGVLVAVLLGGLPFEVLSEVGMCLCLGIVHLGFPFRGLLVKSWTSLRSAEGLRGLCGGLGVGSAESGSALRRGAGGLSEGLGEARAESPVFGTGRALFVLEGLVLPDGQEFVDA